MATTCRVCEQTLLILPEGKVHEDGVILCDPTKMTGRLARDKEDT